MFAPGDTVVRVPGFAKTCYRVQTARRCMPHHGSLVLNLPTSCVPCVFGTLAGFPWIDGLLRLDSRSDEPARSFDVCTCALCEVVEQIVPFRVHFGSQSLHSTRCIFQHGRNELTTVQA